MRIVVLFIALATVGFFTSCKKSDATALKGLWAYDREVTKEYSNNQLIDTDTEQSMGQTIEFKDGGKVSINIPGAGSQEFDYSVSGSTLTMGGQTFEIQDLKSSSVTLFHVEDPGPNKIETFTYLKK